MLINWNWIETGYPLSSKGAARGKKSETTAKTHLDANLQNKWALHINARIVPNQIVTDAETDICKDGQARATNWCKDIRSDCQIVIDAETNIWWTDSHQLVQGYPVRHYHQRPHRRKFLSGFRSQVWTKQTVWGNLPSGGFPQV